MYDTARRGEFVKQRGRENTRRRQQREIGRLTAATAWFPAVHKAPFRHCFSILLMSILLSGFVSTRKNPRKHMARGYDSHLCSVLYYLHFCSHRYSSDNSNTEKYTRVL